MFARLAPAMAVLAMLYVFPAGAETPPPQPGSTQPTSPDKAAADEAKRKKEKDEAEARNNAALLQGEFWANVLAGDTTNHFRIGQPANRLGNVTVTVKWLTPDGPKICPDQMPAPDTKPVGAIAPVAGETTKTSIAVPIPPPPCLWPLRQNAEITINAAVEGIPNPKPLFSGVMSVSGFWFPFLTTIIVLAVMYPGGAAASWYASKRQYSKKVNQAKPNESVGDAPNFWASLDPVELTKNPYGRGSIAKLQIFTFSFIVFGLLLFNVLRTGLLANMSKDVLVLMGISAVGAVGGKIAYLANRRLSLDNWAWLRRKGWLEPSKDIAPHAKWSELLVDSSTKEFDPYRFQMAIFSLVVAIALIAASATGLEAFTVPPEMLGLLGISQVVFIGGQAMEGGGYAELDKKLTDVLKLEKNYSQLKSDASTARANAAKAAAAGVEPAKTPAETAAEAEFAKYQNAVAQAAESFAAIYDEQIGPNPPPPLVEARKGIVAEP